MDRRLAPLNDLVAALVDDIAFHERAIGRVTRPSFTKMFARIKRGKEAIVADLRGEVALQGGRASERGTWLGALRADVTDMRAAFADDCDACFVAALEAQEDRTLAAFREAMASDLPSRVRDIAATHLPEIEQMHDAVRSLKRSLEG